MTDAWDSDRVGVRFSPLSPFNDMSDAAPEETFRAAAGAMQDAGLAYVHLVEPAEPKPPVDGDAQERAVFSGIREAFGGTLVANGNYDAGRARDAIDRGYADVIAFGRALLANPDLPRRRQEGLPINVPDEETFYNGDERGYTDYPTWDELQNGAAIETLDAPAELAPRG